MEKETKWEIGWYEEKDKLSMLKANREEYGDSEITSASYFDWLQTRNPAGSPVIPVAREVETGRVVGFMWFVPARIVWRGELRLALLGFNLLVVKEYRRQGISKAITNFTRYSAIVKEKGYLLGINFTNPVSTSVRSKSEDILVSTVPLVIRPLDIASLSKTYVSSPLIQWGVRVGWAICGSTVFREQRAEKRKPSVEVVEVGEFDGGFDRFWEQVKTKYDLMVVRDRAFLQWRFRDTGFRSYQILAARYGGDILGYLVLRQAKVRGGWLGLVADFLVAPGELGEHAGLCLMQEAARRFREARVLMGGGMMLPHTQEYKIMRRAGYLLSPAKLTPQTFALVVYQAMDIIPSSDLRRPETWFISIADHDAV